MNPVTSIIHKAFNKSNTYNIITGQTHERYETGLAKTKHNFYAFQHESFKTWNTKYAPIPANYSIMPKDSVYRHLNYDFILSQNKFGQFQVLSSLARQLHLPMISLEHTLPLKQWDDGMRKSLKEMRGDINVFISEFSCKAWGFDPKDDDVRIIHHCVDNELFKPTEQEKKLHILSVVNDWVNRNHCCNFEGWQRITKGLPVFVLGDTPGLSKPAESTQALSHAYSSSAIFLNTSTVSPIPTALLEAMSCGVACVSTATCMIPEIIQNGVNGFISNNEDELRGYLEELLNNSSLRKSIGQKARQTIINNFGEEKFTSQWNQVFNLMSERYYK